MRIILLGPPGSGKGTQGDLIEEKYGFPKISSGDLLREAVSQGSELGKKAEDFMNRGELVSDELVVAMIKDRIAAQDCQAGFTLDGFPRTIPQAESLVAIDPASQEVVLDIQLTDKLIIERISARRICSLCGNIFNLRLKVPAAENLCDLCGGELIQRKDDTPEVISRRLRVYRELTLPLVRYYSEKRVYFPIKGESKVEDVFAQVEAVLEKNIPGLRITS